MLKLHTIEAGKGRKRVNYGRIREALEMPNLIEIQRKSYENFLEEGLTEVLYEISPITDFSGNLELYFVGYTLDPTPKYSIEECKERDASYSGSLKVKVRLVNKSTGEIKEQDIFVGDFPLMTETGNFIINGAERVIVSQLVRSPGIYYSVTHDKYNEDIKIINSTVIPNRGAWLEYEIDANNIFTVRIDRNRKVPITVLLRALGYSTNPEILELLGEDERILSTLEKDTTTNTNEALIEIYKKLRPGEPPTVESATSLMNNLFFDPRRYDLAKVGRYKYNKKLAFSNRIVGKACARDVINKETGEVIASTGDIFTSEIANTIQDSGVFEVYIQSDVTGKDIKVITNAIVDITKYVDIDPSEFKITERVDYVELKKILDQAGNDQEEIKKLISERVHLLVPNNITRQDIIASINYCLNLIWNIGKSDDIDHLGNRRLRCVGELLQNQFRIGFSRMERVIKERMNIQDIDSATPQALINIRPVNAAIREFFGSSQLSQFMDQTNPLAELTNKRRLSALGPGGLSRERAGFEVRDVHYSHYGRMCPIETPEGPNIGLINSLSTYARVNDYGFIEAPYRIIDKEKGIVTNTVKYVTADEEDGKIIAQASEELDKDGRFVHKKVTVRIKADIIEESADKVELMDVSPRQLVSVATAMIPFLENDDANRALMGSNMQRQAVPLLKPEAPIVGTGIEYKAAKDSGVVILAKEDGVVKYASSNEIVIGTDEGTEHKYKLTKFTRSNQGTCINQRPRVKVGERIEKGEVIADGPSTDYGEISLGRNILIGFMTWEGYNYEDAVLISEKLVKEDVYTSVHIEEYELEARDTKLGPEEITRDIPQVGEDALKDLDDRGIIRIGAEICAGDILVGKVTPKGETELTAEERLLRAIFGEKAREVRDTSLRVPHGESGIVVDVKVFKRENGDELSPGVNELVRIYIAQKRKISVGDKMAGRHGNKGVISRVLPEEDMPFLDNGTPLQIVLNPLGVPSRMNIGQVLEMHTGVAAKVLGFRVATPVFDGATGEDIVSTLRMANDRLNTTDEEFVEKYKDSLQDDVMKTIIDNKAAKEEWMGVNVNETGKLYIRDGRTGEYFDNPVTVGYMYYLKLHHLVDDKIHARSTGPYSLVTQQPLGGKAQFGGQRFGEMEVWALEAYGAAYTLQEILTVKSDDVVGRVKTYEAIVKGENVPGSGVPESFKVLIKELQSLCLDVKLMSEDNQEIEIKGSMDDDVEEMEGINIEGLEDVYSPPQPQSEVVEDEPDVDKDDDDDDISDILTNYEPLTESELSADDISDNLEGDILDDFGDDGSEDNKEF